MFKTKSCFILKRIATYYFSSITGYVKYNKDSFKHIYGITTGLGLNYQTKTALSLL